MVAFVATGARLAVPGRARRGATVKCTAESGAVKIGAAVAATGALLAATITVAEPANAALFHFRAPRPNNVGLRSERYLDNCPPTNNCISSMANIYDSHFVPAWTYGGGPKKEMKEAVQDLLDVIAEYPGATVIEQRPAVSEVGEGYYIYCEFETPLMGFVDDVEFYFQPKDLKTVEYRSASRIGESDLGANRTRIRDIRVALQEKGGWASEGY